MCNIWKSRKGLKGTFYFNFLILFFNFYSSLYLYFIWWVNIQNNVRKYCYKSLNRRTWEKHFVWRKKFVDWWTWWWLIAFLGYLKSPFLEHTTIHGLREIMCRKVHGWSVSDFARWSSSLDLVYSIGLVRVQDRYWPVWNGLEWLSGVTFLIHFHFFWNSKISSLQVRVFFFFSCNI